MIENNFPKEVQLNQLLRTLIHFFEFTGYPLQLFLVQYKTYVNHRSINFLSHNMNKNNHIKGVKYGNAYQLNMIFSYYPLSRKFIACT